MSKYPCGECTIGVRTKGILCTGHCTLWYHSKCLGWSDKQYKNLTKTEIENWKCKKCLQREQTNHLKDIEEKVHNFENSQVSDMETSLTLAAEVGNALLEENSSLKEQIQNLTQKNLELAHAASLKANSSLQLSLEAKLEQLEKENEILLNRNAILTEKLNEAEKQLEKETQSRKELEYLFEEFDTEKEQTIRNYEDNTKKLKIELNQLREERNKENSSEILHKKTEHVQTQTHNMEQSLPQCSSSLAAEIQLIKNRQSDLEMTVETMKDLLQSVKNTKPTLQLTPLKQQNHNRRLNMSTSSMKRNYFSVSLQNAKYKAAPVQQTNSPPCETNKTSKPEAPTDVPRTSHSTPLSMRSCKKKFQVTIGPPITATKLKPTETIEEFYKKNIKYPELQENDGMDIHFLEILPQKNFKEKSAITN